MKLHCQLNDKEATFSCPLTREEMDQKLCIMDEKQGEHKVYMPSRSAWFVHPPEMLKPSSQSGLQGTHDLDF